MNQSPSAVDPSGQKSGVLVVRWHDDTQFFVGPEILGERERDARPPACIGCICHSELLKLRHVGNTWVFDSPQLLWVLFGVWQKCWFTIDLPPIDAVY